jgi:hypothetical protein
MDSDGTPWPELPFEALRPTLATLHLWMQIIGKLRLSLTPWVNHSWQVPLYVTARGLGTSPIPFGSEVLEVEFDFLSHRLGVCTSRGDERALALAPQPVAEFYARVVELLTGVGVPVAINPRPCELPDPIPFAQDRVHSAYEPAAAQRFWRALLQADRVLKQFRTAFIGKVSPVHFFWGSFDLAVTRFSGRPAPLHPGGIPNLSDAVTREAYSHEVSSAGFWAGSESYPRAAFYSYAWPEPPGFRDAPVAPAASYDTTFGEFILPYDAIREAADPDLTLLDFLTRTYAAAADAGHWDRAALECPPGVPGRVRPLE